MEGLIQMKLFVKSFHHFRRELGIQRVYLAGLSWCEMDDQKRYDGHKQKGYDLLYDAAADKRQHYSGSLIYTI